MLCCLMLYYINNDNIIIIVMIMCVYIYIYDNNNYYYYHYYYNVYIYIYNIYIHIHSVIISKPLCIVRVQWPSGLPRPPTCLRWAVGKGQLESALMGSLSVSLSLSLSLCMYIYMCIYIYIYIHICSIYAHYIYIYICADSTFLDRGTFSTVGCPGPQLASAEQITETSIAPSIAPSITLQLPRRGGKILTQHLKQIFTARAGNAGLGSAQRDRTPRNQI